MNSWQLIGWWTRCLSTLFGTRMYCVLICRPYLAPERIVYLYNLYSSICKDIVEKPNSSNAVRGPLGAITLHGIHRALSLPPGSVIRSKVGKVGTWMALEATTTDGPSKEHGSLPILIWNAILVEMMFQFMNLSNNHLLNIGTADDTSTNWLCQAMSFIRTIDCSCLKKVVPKVRTYYM